MLIAGIDEAGRGPLAGPVVAAAVILDPARPIAGLADSKVLSAGQREALARQIAERALCHAIVAVGEAEIDRLNILHATMAAMSRAARRLWPRPTEILVDGNRLPPALGVPARAIVRGDATEPAISAASILAKTFRDALMRDYDHLHPGYGFAQHMGYPTPEHLESLRRLGPCAIHRRSFAPVRALLEPAASGLFEV
jgi:ribonuclease HII